MTTKIASFCPSESVPVPISAPDPIISDSLLDALMSAMNGTVRTKPSYADTWILDSDMDLPLKYNYMTDCSSVSIVELPNGEYEYRAMPFEYSYPDGLNSIVKEVIDGIRTEHLKSGMDIDRGSVTELSRMMLDRRWDDLKDACGDDCDMSQMMDDLGNVIHRHSVGLGVFDILLRDRHIEDIYLDAPCTENRIYVTLNGLRGLNSHMRCRTNLMVEEREMSNLITNLRVSSGLRFSQSDPVLETDLHGYDARATLIGYPMSPKGDALAIRKHSVRPWTLTRLIFNGTINPEQAGILSFLVDNRCTFLICGPRGAGKSSMLSALMFEFPREQRILTMEDTLELPCDTMRRLGYKVQSILLDDRLGGDAGSRADEALRVSLRLGESSLVLGEVRGEEAVTLYRSMRVGRAGSSVMGTVHGDSAESVYHRIVDDLGIPAESFSATDIILTMGTVCARSGGHLIRRMEEMVCTTKEPCKFKDVSGSIGIMMSDIIDRVLKTSQKTRGEISREISIRAKMRSCLAEHAAENENFLGPEWILRANDILRASPLDRQLSDIIGELESAMGVQG
ncbi:type II/IV secretion system protein [methanogenic archaeon mixed culture ISO4-G1]|nr:type II/IV secretion system protein [methanogenic archaeon mixed culture ISO4-G1]